MQESPQQIAEAGPRQIHLDEAYEVRHWVLKWGVTTEQLLRAVRKVGPLVENVRRELEK